MRLHLIPVAEITAHWPMVSPLFRKLEAGHINSTHILRTLESGRRRLWLAADEEKVHAVCTTEIIDYQLVRACRVGWCAGENINLWADYLSEIERFALEQGCDAMEMQGRRGWGKVFPDYKEQSVIIGKQLCS